MSRIANLAAVSAVLLAAWAFVAPSAVAQSCPPTGWNIRVDASVSPTSGDCVINIVGPALAQGTLRMAAFNLPLTSPHPIAPGMLSLPFTLDCGGKFEFSVPLTLMADLVDVHGALSLHMQATLSAPPPGGGPLDSEIWTVQICETSASAPVFPARIGGIEPIVGSTSLRTWTTFQHTGLVLGPPRQFLVQSSPFAFSYTQCVGPTGIEGLLPVNGQ